MSDYTDILVLPVDDDGGEWAVVVGKAHVQVATYDTQEAAWAYGAGLRDGFNEACREVRRFAVGLGDALIGMRGGFAKEIPHADS